MMRDLALGVRSLRAAPVLTLAAVLTLILGMGATTAIFSVGNALLLRPLPVAEPERLVTITSETALRFGFQGGAGWSYPMWSALQQRAGAFDGAFAWTLRRVDLSDGGEMQPAEALFASGDVFRTLGVTAAVGRMFTIADDVRGGGPDGAVAVISHEFWQRRFNGQSSAVGSVLAVEGAPLTIVGIAPRGFRGVDIGQAFDLAVPFGAEPLVRGPRSLLDEHRAYLLNVMLRLKPQQPMTEAAATLRAMQPDILAALNDPPQFLREPFVLVSASTGISDRSRLRQQYTRPLVTLAIVSGLVLLIVCANVANLLLARAAARRRELSVRAALGAPSWLVARPLLAEALLLAAAGAAGGTILAMWASRALVAQLPAPAGRVQVDLAIDWRVLAFTTGVTLLAVIVSAALPAFQAMRAAPAEALQDDGRVGGGRRTVRATAALVVVQLALSIVLGAAAGLFGRTLHRLANLPLGFDARDLVVFTVDTARVRVEPAARLALYERIIQAMAAMPGATHAAGSAWTALGAGTGGLLTDASGRRADIGPQSAVNFVSPGWFATYSTRIHGGRDFDGRDTATAPRVALINETLRRSLAPARSLNPGDTIDVGPCRRAGCTVVGIVGDAVYGRSLRDGPPPTVYLPLAQSAGLAMPSPTIHVTVRSAGDPAHIVRAGAAALNAVDPALKFTARTLQSDVSAALAQERIMAALAAFFGVVALLLSAVGLYGVTAFAVTRRRNEIGIRLALGAQPAGVVRLVLRRIAGLVVAGAALGLAASLWLSTFVAPLLYGLESRDPGTLAVATAGLAAVAVLAGWIPASRAARMDPARVLRQS